MDGHRDEVLSCVRSYSRILTCTVCYSVRKVESLAISCILCTIEYEFAIVCSFITDLINCGLVCVILSVSSISVFFYQHFLLSVYSSINIFFYQCLLLSVSSSISEFFYPLYSSISVFFYQRILLSVSSSISLFYQSLLLSCSYCSHTCTLILGALATEVPCGRVHSLSHS